MQRYKARELLHFTREQIWALDPGNNPTVEVEYDDGVLQVLVRQLIFSSYFHRLHRVWPAAPLLKQHQMTDMNLTSKTSLVLLGRVMFDVLDHDPANISIEDLTVKVYEITNEIYNDFTYRLEPYVTSISALDFLDVLDDPVISAAVKAAQPTQDSISDTYAIIEARIKEPGAFPGNRIAESNKSAIVSAGQTNQCIGIRGFLTDINSQIFGDPIMTSYGEGFRTKYDSMIESRSAAKSLLFNKNPLQLTEYFNRELQLSTAVLRNLHMSDCGTTRTLPIMIKGSKDKANPGKFKIHPAYVGKYYQTDKGLKQITRGDHHLVGTVVNARSVLQCEHSDPYGICAVCFGALADSIPAGTNIGHVSVTELCQRISQIVLSTKHLDGSSTVDKFVIPQGDKRFIAPGKTDNDIRLSPALDGAKVRLIVQGREAQMLSNIYEVDDVSVLQLPRISELTTISFEVTYPGKQGMEIAPVQVSTGSRRAGFTHELLRYLKDRTWEVDEKGHYYIDLTEYPRDEDILTLPMVHMNMLDYMSDIEKLVKFTGPYEKLAGVEMSDPYELADVLSKMFDLVTSRLDVNIAHLETILAATMIRSEEQRDYRLPTKDSGRMFSGFTANTTMRSLGMKMSHQDHASVLKNPLSYIVTTRAGHPFDPILKG